MRLLLALFAVALLGFLATTGETAARDKPASTARLQAYKFAPMIYELDNVGGQTGGFKFSKEQIEAFVCESSGDPSESVDLSCNDTEFGQDFAPDNEIAVAVDPEDPDHIVAGSNDYFYRFNNSTGARQAIVPTGFFTSFDGGETWIDGQIPMQFGNGAGDPSPAFDASHDVVLMAQLENVGGQGGPFVAQGDVTVSRSTDGGVTWSESIRVMHGTGAGIGPANQAKFYDKEWLTVDNNPDSPFFGRAYLTSTLFVNGLQGSFTESPIVLSYSDDGGRTWTAPKEISGSHPSCSFQSVPPDNTDCDEDQFSIPEVASDGTLYVHFLNGQNESAWEVAEDLDDQIMIVKSTDGGATFSAPVPTVQMEDGFSDMPFSVIGRQTVWGHQIRWASAGNISVNPNDPDDVTIVFSDRGTPNPNATEDCFHTSSGGLNIGTAPDYDPCDAGPGSDTDVFMVRSTDGGANWGPRTLVDDGDGAHQWFPWADHKSDGSLAIAWDEDTTPPPADSFVHVLLTSGGKEVLSPAPEQIDISLTHWAGQYVPPAAWPAACGPADYTDPPVEDAEGKDCNVFHGDYTGLAVGPDDSVHVVWTGLNREATSPQVDFYTGEPHDGFAQDAMYARR